jgi:branched-chain amino acid transport system ATP-binding protein
VPSRDEVILSGEGLHLDFGAIMALDGVNFDVRRGEVVSIIGPNGAGKTCLINCVSGYYRPQRGHITFQGRELVGLKPHQVARAGISRTFQDPTTYPSLTALEILMAGRYRHTHTTLAEALVYYGRSRREEIQSRKIVEDVISFTGIGELRRMPLAAMSYGQRKQVEIARALVMQPDVMLLDEPMSGLDEVMKEIVGDLILEMNRQGMTIVLVEHDIQAVLELSHRVIVLDHGLLIAAGSPADICANARVAEAYLGGEVCQTTEAA